MKIQGFIANAVADALSCKNHAEVASLLTSQKRLIQEFEKLNIEFSWDKADIEMASLVAEPSIIEKIKEAQQHDLALQTIKREVPQGKYTDFRIGNDEIIRMNGRLCVPDDHKLRKEIMNEAHSSGYSIHPGGTKIYQDVKSHYWWNEMK